MKRRSNCPGCASRLLSAPFRLLRQPVVLNYRFSDAHAASRVARKNLTLVQCLDCGLVFNATFDVGAIPYDGNYENRQCFSPAFTAHLQKLANGLVERNDLRGGRILEVGCGKGDFLRLICSIGKARGEGYDTSFESRAEPEPPGLEFHRSYVCAADITSSFDAIICRHVVEHVPEIGQFLRDLHAIALAAGDPVVFIETPRFEWIVEELSLWDVFYEHCNYFPTSSLAHLCRLAGFRVVRHRPVFGAQYQSLEMRVAKTARALKPPGVPAQARLGDFAKRAARHLDSLAKKIAKVSGSADWAVWGAGAKGVALVNLIPSPKPLCVVDSNPAKQGGTLPGTRIPIVSPKDPRLDTVGLIVIANPNYAAEITTALEHRSYAGRVFTL